MNLNPIQDRVVLTRNQVEETTASGLYIAPNARDNSTVATVIAVGPGIVSSQGALIPTHVKPGQTVLIGKWKGDIVMLENVEHLILRESEILAVVE